MFCVSSAMRELLLKDDMVLLKKYAQELALQNRYMWRFRRDGFWSAEYVESHNNIQPPFERRLLEYIDDIYTRINRYIACVVAIN